MPIVTIFRSRLRAGVEEEYGPVALAMSDLVQQMDGFVSHSFYASPDGERVTIVTFADEESQRAWASHPLHQAAQRRGRSEFYASFELTVCEQMRHSSYEASKL